MIFYTELPVSNLFELYWIFILAYCNFCLENKFIVMIDNPIRKRQNVYPKDFTPSQRVLNTPVQQKTTESEKK